MKTTQMACLQKLVNALQECEAVGVTFSTVYPRLDVQDDESHYLENISSEKLSDLLNFIDGWGDVKSVELKALSTPDAYIGYDSGVRSRDYSCKIEIKDGIVTKWEIGE